MVVVAGGEGGVGDGGGGAGAGNAGMHNFHPLISTELSDDQAIAAVGVMPLGPDEFPEYRTPFTVSASK
jgi:hypothetical protein